MGFEHMPPAISPDTTPRQPRIEFTPEKLFGSELGIAREIALSKTTEGANLRPDTFPHYIDTLGQLEERYTQVALRQGEGGDTAMLVRAAFEGLKVAELLSHPDLDFRSEEGSIPESLKHEIGWQVYSAEYLTELNRKYTPREATQRASVFWQSQEKMWKGHGDVVAKKIPFESLKNGVLRSVALGHVISRVNGWEIYPERDPVIDAIHKIDMVAITPLDHMFLFQIKERDVANPDAAERGWAIHPVTAYGPKEYAYLGQFQKGVERYIRDNGVDAHEAIGVFVELSAKSTYVNKETGMPQEEFARSMAQELAALDASLVTSAAA